MAKGVKTIPTQPITEYHLRELFSLSIVKSELAALSLSQESFKTYWVGVMRKIAQDEFTTAFWGSMSAAIIAFRSAMIILRKFRNNHLSKSNHGLFFIEIFKFDLIPPRRSRQFIDCDG